MNKIIKEWILKEPISSVEFSKYPELPEIIVKLLYDREVSQKDSIDNFLNPDYADLLDPFLIKDMRKAVDRIFMAASKKQKILIFGDYDADGISGAMILYQSVAKVYQIMNSSSTMTFSNDMSSVSRENLDIYIPDRAKEGYGLNDETLNSVLQKSPNLIITVDCGVTSESQIKILQEQNIDVIVVDHHSVPEVMPPAHVIIVPKRVQDPYPFKDLCGAGLAFKVGSALIKELQFQGFGHLIPEGFEKWLLDFAAIGTIADMVPLKGENRIIVKYGLYVLAKTKNLGLKKLLEVSKIKSETLELFSDGKKDSVISVYSVGFQIAPRINSAGRIAHANMAVELFRSTSETESKQLAMDLNLLNEDRKTLTEEVMKQVEQRLQNYGELFDRMNLIFEGDETWPSGILGIVAGRLMEKYYKPVILFQKKNHLNVASARSIKGFDLAKTIHSIKSYLEAGGGHAQAAGMSFQPNNTQQIKDIFKEEIEKSLNIDQMNPKLFIDAEISSNEISWKTYDSLVKLSPYGISNPEPIFIVKKMMVKNFELIGQDKNHIKVFFQPEVTAGLVTTYQAIGFNLSHLMEEIYEKDIVDIVFKLDVNEWNDKRDLQLNLLDMRKSDRR